MPGYLISSRGSIYELYCGQKPRGDRDVSSPLFILSGGGGGEHLVDVTELPEENQQLLMELDLLGRMRQVSLDERVVEQPGHTFQDEA